MKALIGKVKLSTTKLSVIQSPEVTGRAAPLTPDQAFILLTGWATYHDTQVRRDERMAVVTIAPMLVDDEVYAAIRVGEAQGSDGFTVLLEPHEFNIVADQFDRTRNILNTEQRDADRTPAPPSGEGRPAPDPPPH